jgi:hypothetical protein
MGTPQAWPGTGTTADDLMILLFGAVLAGPAALAFAWSSVVGWLVDHHVLVDAAVDPLLTIPASSGAGLDPPRLLLLSAAVLALLALASSAAIRMVCVRAAGADR